MSAPTASRMMRQLTRTLPTKPLTRSLHVRAASKLQHAPKPRLLATQSPARSFSAARPAYKGLQPDQEDPAPVESEAIHIIKDATPISDEEFHEQAEKLLEEICQKMEEMQESRDDVDAEYSVCLSFLFCSLLPHIHALLPSPESSSSLHRYQTQADHDCIS